MVKKNAEKCIFIGVVVCFAKSIYVATILKTACQALCTVPCGALKS